MTAVPGPREVVCTCGPGVWATCDQCGTDAWCSHHCDFPCDDVTCEGGVACTGCLTGRLCPVHNDDDEEEVVTAVPGPRFRDQLAEAAWGVLDVAARTRLTDWNVVAHAIVENQLPLIAAEREQARAAEATVQRVRDLISDWGDTPTSFGHMQRIRRALDGER